MKTVPENQQDIKKLLYEQIPVLIKKLECCNPGDAYTVTQAIISILHCPW